MSDKMTLKKMSEGMRVQASKPGNQAVGVVALSASAQVYLRKHKEARMTGMRSGGERAHWW